VLLSLSSLHDSHNDSINDVLSFNSDLLLGLLILLVFSNFLLLVGLGGNKLNSDVIIGKSLIDTNFLIRSKLRFLHVFLVQKFLFGIAQIEQSIVQFTFCDGTVILDFIISESSMLIKETQHNSLIAVNHKDVFLSSKQG